MMRAWRKPCGRFTSLFTVALLGLLAEWVAAGAPNEKARQKVERAGKAAVKPARSFRSLLRKGQLVTLQRRNNTPDKYQVRIVSEAQKKRVENLLAANKKRAAEQELRLTTLQRQMGESSDVAELMELRNSYEKLRKSIRERKSSFYKKQPSDLYHPEFHRIIDVGVDYVAFARNGVKRYHRLSSIHSIIIGVELDEE